MTFMHHAGLSVPDIEAAINFFVDALDLQVAFSGGWEAPSPVMDQITGLEDSAAKSCLLISDGICLELFEYHSPRPHGNPSIRQASDLGLRHICIEVSDTSAALQKWIDAGGQKLNDPATVKGGGSAVYCRDPFGNLFEFLEAGGRMPSRVAQAGEGKDT